MNWLFKSSIYFNICFVFGLLFWVVLGFDFSTNQLQMIAAESNEPDRDIASEPQDIYAAQTMDDRTLINSISDKDLEALLVGTDKDQKEVVEQIQNQEAFLNSFESSYADLTVDEEGNKLVTSTSNTIDYEDIKSCKPNRLTIEKVIEAKKKDVADFLIERDDPPETNERNMPRRCVTHVMNKFNLSSFFFARCAGPTGSPSRGGMKPCISKILVNYTYNALMDVADCMNINPKSLLPKLSNESGLIINTFGSGMDAGVGPLTGDAIEEVNKYFDGYLREIRAAATAGKVSCQRIVKNPKLITLVAAGSGSRCGLIAPVEKINFNRVVEMVNLVGYNAGPPTAFKMFMDYLNRRVAYNKLPNVKRRLLTEVDFDFHNPKKQKDDIDGVERTVVEIARLNVNAPMIKKEEKPNKTRLDRIRALPEKIRTSHLLTFPEFLIYRQNNFDASILNPTNLGRVNDVKNPEEKEKERGKYPSFKTLAAPGYLNFLAAKDNAIRTTFETAGQSQWLCSDKNFLKIKPVK